MTNLHKTSALFLNCLLLLGVVIHFVGCTPVNSSGPRRRDGSTPAEKDERPLVDRIDEALEFTIRERRLNSQDQAAWQVVHGILAFGKEFPLKHDGQDVTALDYLLQGGSLKGWSLVPGNVLDTKTQRRGVRALVERGSLSGQGHCDQWLGYFSQAGISLETALIVEEKKYTLDDYLLQVERDVYQNTENEFSWTLMALASFRPSDYTWTAGDGSAWSVDKLVQLELDQDLLDSPCGGMHRLSGLAMARQRRIDDGGKMEGAWANCDTRIRECLEKIEQYQSADGCFSVNFTERGGTPVDLPNAMHCNGHTLEFVVLASTDEQLKLPWVEKAVAKMCDLFQNTESLDLECGALYHAAHALVLYRQRMYGPRKYLEDQAAKPTAAQPRA